MQYRFLFLFTILNLSTTLPIDKPEMLNVPGFTPPPNPDKENTVIPPNLYQLYYQQSGKQMDIPDDLFPGSYMKIANTVRTYAHSESELDLRFTVNNIVRLMFEVNKLPENEIVTGVELRINRNRNSNVEDRQILEVHEILEPSSKSQISPTTKLLDSKLIYANSSTIILDVLPAVQRWIEDPDKNYGLIVKVLDENRRRVHDTLAHIRRFSYLDENQPFLFIYLDDQKNKDASLGNNLSRNKRSADNKYRKKSGAGSCRRKPMEVVFEHVGWNDWIVAPPAYDAYYCAGDCPFPLADHLNSTNHAVVQTLMHSVYPTLVPKACCVPTQLAPISMLYLDEDNRVVLKLYQDMTVVACGCH